MPAQLGFKALAKSPVLLQQPPSVTAAALMETTRTNSSILASSLVNDYLRQPTYAETLRQSHRSPLAPTAAGNVKTIADDRASSICSSAASTATLSRLGNGWNCGSGSTWFSNTRSILVQEKATEEREQYQQLLEKLVPRLYTTENGPKSISPIPNLNTARRRSTALLSAAASAAMARKSLAQQSRRSHSNNASLQSLKRPPLSSTINLNDDENDDGDDDDGDDDDGDDDDGDDDDVTITGISKISNKLNRPISGASVKVDDDDNDVTDLDDDDIKILSACSAIKKQNDEELAAKQKMQPQSKVLPYVPPVNTLQAQLAATDVYQNDWMPNFTLKWDQRKRDRETKLHKLADE